MMFYDRMNAVNAVCTVIVPETVAYMEFSCPAACFARQSICNMGLKGIRIRTETIGMPITHSKEIPDIRALI